MIARLLVLATLAAASAVTAAAQPTKGNEEASKKPPCEPQPDCLVLALPAPPASPFGGERDAGIMINGFQPRRQGQETLIWGSK